MFLLLVLIRLHLFRLQKKVIENRFGFTPNGERQTLEKIGLKLKVTRERVRQIELVALFKIKNFLESNNYKK